MSATSVAETMQLIDATLAETLPTLKQGILTMTSQVRGIPDKNVRLAAFLEKARYEELLRTMENLLENKADMSVEQLTERQIKKRARDIERINKYMSTVEDTIGADIIEQFLVPIEKALSENALDNIIERFKAICKLKKAIRILEKTHFTYPDQPEPRGCIPIEVRDEVERRINKLINAINRKYTFCSFGKGAIVHIADPWPKDNIIFDDDIRAIANCSECKNEIEVCIDRYRTIHAPIACPHCRKRGTFYDS